MHGHFIDYKNEILYIFGGHNNIFNALNLKTNTMIEMGSNYCGTFVKSVLIPSTNEIHILKNSKNHFIFDCNNKVFRKVNCDRDVLINSQIGDIKLIYCEFNKQLMIFGGDANDKIFYCNINQSTNDKIEWKLNNKIKMPNFVYDEFYYDIIVFGD
eukprot:185446_1